MTWSNIALLKMRSLTLKNSWLVAGVLLEIVSGKQLYLMIYLISNWGINDRNIYPITPGFTLDSQLIPRQKGGKSPLFFVYSYREGRRGAKYRSIWAYLYVYSHLKTNNSVRMRVSEHQYGSIYRLKRRNKAKFIYICIWIPIPCSNLPCHFATQNDRDNKVNASRWLKNL